MFARITYIKFTPGKSEEGRKIYQEEVVPALKQQKGCVNIMLLQSVDGSEESLSLTIWQSKEDADAYDVSGKYRELVGKVRHLFSEQPVLKSYQIAE